MNLFPDINELIHTQNLLSSTTYPFQTKPYCAYCGTPIIGHLVFHKKDSFTIHRCTCDHALEEVSIKYKVIDELERLDIMKERMNLELIGNALYEDGVERLRRKYKPTI
jgi:hypothetical protein